MTTYTIHNALAALGVKGITHYHYITHDRILVSVDGEYFGIWDADKNTFVD